MFEALQEFAQKAADALCGFKTYREPAGLPRPKVIAHRGAWGPDIPENTLRAMERTREFNAWAAEFDVRFTRDGVPVVSHDEDLRRCHGRPERVRDLTFKELRAAIPAVPALEEVLQVPQLHFMIEIKQPLEPAQIQSLTRLLKDMTPVADYHLLTLKPELIRATTALPEPSWVLVGDVGLRRLARISLDRNLGGVAGHYLFMPRDLVGRLHEKGQMAGVGFIPNQNLYNRAWAAGVDWVFTNHLRNLV